MSRPAYAYHISGPRLHTPGERRVTLTPRSLVSGEERLSHIERICVAPTPSQCLCALGVHLVFTRWFYVYRTVQPVVSHPAQDVHDSDVTGEGWLLEPTEFELVACLPRASFDEFVVLSDDDEDRLDVDMLLLNFDRRGRPETLADQHDELQRIQAFLDTHWDAFEAITERVSQEELATPRVSSYPPEAYLISDLPEPDVIIEVAC